MKFRRSKAFEKSGPTVVTVVTDPVITMYKKVIVKIGFIDEKGNLQEQAVRVLEWEKRGIQKREFLREYDYFNSTDQSCDVTIPGTSD